MAQYNQIYRCRLCNKIFANGTATCNKQLADEVTFELAINGKSKEIMAGGLLATHRCENGMLAIGDFVGWDVDEAYSKS